MSHFFMSPALVRHLVAIACGGAVALGLFWLMNAMISGSAGELDAARQRMVMNFIRIDEAPTPVQQRERRRPRPPEPPKPTPRMESMQAPSPMLRAPQMKTPTPDFRPNLSMTGIPVMATGMDGLVAYSQPMTPLSQVQPMYPRRALMEGISGWVRLSFVINPDGSVRDIQVLEASPRRGIFDHEARRALSRWRFAPQTIAGEAVAAHATITINFSLDQ
ncbi:TonB family protein [Desulfurispirillum indicum S5]|uniref:Protein TonB n=1 Tax=Desulfurispirillum indicum (strain ATCC BAA-1389 / DSM 22839 / S5) TaxID=653733 RepID=E6W227_DESIS|nr:energy transducer TonB [Desulfurispirillum indicum]ADU66653.1 TonB family protein [Desulfurispirillum indicum S5]